MQLFQGEEPAHDFLSLRAGGPSSPPFQHRDTQHSSQGYGVEMHRSLKPMELAKQRSRSNGNGTAARSASPAGSDSEEHVLPGGVGTFSIRQASCTPSREEAATRADGRSSASSADQGPSTPRSKHSATEQRRRTKINDRQASREQEPTMKMLEILRELLPHTDQKRDKASFLSEVIEYIRFLQEKVQKYETADPERNHEDSKSMPWAKVYYRSCWRNTQNISQVQGGDLSPSTQDMNNEQYGSKQTSVAHPAPFNTQSITSAATSSSHMAAGTPQNWEKNSTSSNQPPWLSMSTTHHESESGNRMLKKHERQTHDDENHSISSAYSQGSVPEPFVTSRIKLVQYVANRIQFQICNRLFNRLTEALKKSGLDPSQTNISVEINMSKRARENTGDNSKCGRRRRLDGWVCSGAARLRLRLPPERVGIWGIWESGDFCGFRWDVAEWETKRLVGGGRGAGGRAAIREGHGAGAGQSDGQAGKVSTPCWFGGLKRSGVVIEYLGLVRRAFLPVSLRGLLGSYPLLEDTGLGEA
uniref:BHLH domain-containing protein n=1 Tax=Leersia perrieri TaxID=77586 RepID=A0A0D9VKH6_9ORYZ